MSILHIRMDAEDEQFGAKMKVLQEDVEHRATVPRSSSDTP